MSSVSTPNRAAAGEQCAAGCLRTARFLAKWRLEHEHAHSTKSAYYVHARTCVCVCVCSCDEGVRSPAGPAGGQRGIPRPTGKKDQR